MHTQNVDAADQKDTKSMMFPEISSVNKINCNKL